MPKRAPNRALKGVRQRAPLDSTAPQKASRQVIAQRPVPRAGDLRPYQVEGRGCHSCNEQRLGGILADDGSG